MNLKYNYFLIKNNTKIEKKGEMMLSDHIKEPYITNLKDLCNQNENYRTAIWTSNRCQCTLMTIPVGSDIGIEIHRAHDQIIYIESGNGTAELGDAEDNLTETQVNENDCIFVPKETWHNIKNSGNTPLKLFSIYAPVMHKANTVHKTKADGYKKFA
jgi:mannose-6-phosphate isomerase-like protein (cupin superfamily)